MKIAATISNKLSRASEELGYSFFPSVRFRGGKGGGEGTSLTKTKHLFHLFTRLKP